MALSAANAPGAAPSKSSILFPATIRKRLIDHPRRAKFEAVRASRRRLLEFRRESRTFLPRRRADRRCGPPSFDNRRPKRSIVSVPPRQLDQRKVWRELSPGFRDDGLAACPYIVKSHPETHKAFMKERKHVGYKTPKTY